jgi:hypothetical protein
MGAWGVEGYDSDTGCDWLNGLADVLKFTLNHAFWSRWTEEGIAAAQLLTELPASLQSRLGQYTFNEAMEIVDQELKPENLKPWESPKKRKAYLAQLHAKLLAKHAILAEEEKKTKARMKKIIVVRKNDPAVERSTPGVSLRPRRHKKKATP